MHWKKAATIAGIISAPAIVFGADDSIEALKKQIQELDQKVRILERKRELDEEKPKDSTRVTAGASGFSISSGDTNFVLKLRGYVQADARFYVDDHIPANDTFLMRRVRPIFEGTVFKNYDYRIMLDFSSGVNNSGQNNGFLQDAYLNVHYWPEFQVQVGKFKEPVGLERLQSAANMLFVERGYPTQLVPNRDVGLQLHGELFDSRLYYQAGVFNGVQDAASGDSDVATDDHKDLAARLFAEPFKHTEIAPLKGLGLGVAGTYGNQQGTLPSFKTPGQQTFAQYLTGIGTNVNVVADGTHWRLVPQGYYYWGPFGVFGEYAISSQKVRRDPVASFATIHNTAWQVAGSWYLTGEQNSFKPVTPEHPLSFSDKGWGAWELAARYGQLTLDDEIFPLLATASSAHEARSWAVGINWYLNKNVKWNLDYEQTDFSDGSQKSGDVTAQKEKAILTRVQLAF